MILYWFPPSVLDVICTGAGAVVDAVMTTVLPDGANGADTLIVVVPVVREAWLVFAILQSS